MKYMKTYDSLKDFKHDLKVNNECICVVQVPTPVGVSTGYQRDGEFVFSVDNKIISNDSLRTMDFREFDTNQIESSSVQTAINTCDKGDKMIFSSGTSSSYMDSLYIIDRAHWTGNELIIGVKEDDLYPFIKVWLADGTTDTCDDSNPNHISSWFQNHQNKNNIIKITFGENITTIQSYTLNTCLNLRYFVCSKNCTGLSYDQFMSGSKIQTLTINNPSPPSLGVNDGLSNCKAIYVPAGSKADYVKETNWLALADKIHEMN